jgi:hypothetical protein
MAIQEDLPVHQVSLKNLQRKLIEQKQILRVTS